MRHKRVNHRARPKHRLTKARGTGKLQSKRPRLLGEEDISRDVLDLQVDPWRYDWRRVLQKYWRKLRPRVRALIQNRRVYEGDRSKCVYAIVAGLHDAGASPNEIAAVVWHNPYFISKHGQRLDRLNAEISRIVSKLGRRHDHQ
jgi:hypothetical protein